MERRLPEFGRFAEPSLLILVSLSPEAVGEWRRQ